ncbi:MAG: FHA domain-containing protein [Allobranchiibius sp.]
MASPREAAAALPAPITWERSEGQPRKHPWSAPEPFAAPAERPAPPTPVLASDVQDPQDRTPTPYETRANGPSLDKASAADEPAHGPAPVVAFPDPVPAPPVQPSREPAPAARPQQQPPQQQPQQQPPQQQPPPEPVDDEEALTIGRGRANSIVLDDMLVSRHHVRITADDEGLVLQDLGSRNGTYVNGERVERIALHEGDRLGIGATTFEVRDGWLVSV